MSEWADSNRRPGLIMHVFGCSDLGAVRQNNEDRFLIADPTDKNAGGLSSETKMRVGDRGILLLVSDGMGGRNAGEVASGMIVDAFRSEIFAREPKQTAREFLTEAAKKANWNIWSRAQRCENEQGMGATLTGVLVEAGKAHIVQVGDSRAYVVRDDKAYRLTKDQSMVQTLIDAGVISVEEADAHPYRHIILQSLGAEPSLYPVTSTIDVYDGDYLLLCTDGLTNLVKDSDLAELIFSSPNVESACRALVETANERGGDDNITVIVAAVQYVEAGGSAEADFGMRTHSYFTPSGGLSPPERAETAPNANRFEEHLERVDTPFPVSLFAEEEFKPLSPTDSKDSILIIESDPERLLSFEFILKPYYEVKGAVNGEEGLAKAITESPTLILSGVEVAKMSGLSICQALKSSERFRDVPLILVSDKLVERSHVIEGLKAGADEYLIFPVDERELLLRVKPHAARARLLQNLRYQNALNEAANIQLHAEMETVSKAQQELFQTVLDAASDGILILDPAGWVTAANRPFEAFHGVDREKIVGFGYRALLKKIEHLYENPEKQLQRFIELMENPEMIAEDDLKPRTENENAAIVRYSAPVRDEGGKIYGRFFVFRNLKPLAAGS